MTTHENNVSILKSPNPQVLKHHGRRALGVINQSLVGVDVQPYPCAVNKRAITEEIAPNPMKRPVTRLDAPIRSSNRIDDYKTTDVENCEPTTTNVVVQLSPQKLVMQSQEVEMEDIFEELVMDIDICDAKDHLAVVEYVKDLYEHYRLMEASSCVPQDYMSQQFDINEKMRAILIDWLIEVHYKFELRDETLFLTVNLIDRFLANQSVMRNKLQMVGLIALFLACKYEEVSVPVIEDLIFISDKAYSRNDLLEMEKLMLNTLQFNMSLPTPYVFLTRFLKAAESDKKLELLSFFLIELSLVEYSMLKFAPSLLAAAAVYTAQCTLYGFKQWSKTCQWYSTYSEDHLLECSRLMVEFHQRAETGKLTGVHRKYSTSKFGYAAKYEPALFLLR